MASVTSVSESGALDGPPLTLLDLPPELLAHIMEFGDSKLLAVVSTVCKQLNGFVRYTPWQKIEFALSQEHLMGLEAWSSAMCCITIKSDGRNMDLNPLTALTSLHTLTVTGHIESLEPVGQLPQLRILHMRRVFLPDLSPLTNAEKLRRLVLMSCEISDISPLSQLPQLQTLDLSGSTVRVGSAAYSCVMTPSFAKIALNMDASALNGCKKLQKLHMNECSSLKSIGTLAGLNDLEELSFNRCSHLEELTGLTDLNSVVSLSMYGNTLLNDLWPLVNLAKMTHLNMTGCIGVSDLTPLAFLLNLETLMIGSSGVRDLTALAGLVKLSTLRASNCKIEDISPLAHMSRMRELVLCNTRIWNLTPLRNMKHLEALDVQDCRLVCDVSALRGMPQLHTLFLSHTGVQDISALATIHSLRRVFLEGCHEVDTGPLQKLALIKITHWDER